MEIKRGSAVRSLAGRDKGQLFFVAAVEGAFALLVDGKARREESPKRKNLRHIELLAKQPAESALFSDGGKPPAAEIRKCLSLLAAEQD